jgi:polar amino acid transport system substrate-binding protein
MNVPMVRAAACAAWLCLTMLPGVAQAQAIRAVTEATPWTYLRDGKPAGSAIEIVEMTLTRAGLADHKVSVYPWARSYDLALHEPNVLIFMIARTPAREPLFKWAGEFMRMEYFLYRLKERADVQVRSLAQAHGYTVGVVRDDVRQQFLQRKGLARLVVSAESVDSFRKLLNRQVDLLPLTRSEAASLCRQTGTDCGRLEVVLPLDELATSLHMAYSAATPDATVERTRRAFAQIKAEGGLKRLQQEKP